MEREWSLDRLVAAIKSLAQHESIRSPEEIARIMTEAAQTVNRRRMVERALTRLTAREAEVLHCMSSGPPTEIAARLFISEKTERAHVANILKKLGVRSKLQAVVFAAATGFVELSIHTPTRDARSRTHTNLYGAARGWQSGVSMHTTAALASPSKVRTSQCENSGSGSLSQTPVPG